MNSKYFLTVSLGLLLTGLVSESEAGTFQVVNSWCEYSGFHDADLYTLAEVSAGWEITSETYFWALSTSGYREVDINIGITYKWEIEFVPLFPGETPVLGFSYPIVFETRSETTAKAKSIYAGLSNYADVWFNRGTVPGIRHAVAPYYNGSTWRSGVTDPTPRPTWDYPATNSAAGVSFSWNGTAWRGIAQAIDLTHQGGMELQAVSTQSALGETFRNQALHIIEVNGSQVSTPWVR